MASRPTIQDLAKESGVSVATVDRVLNGRAKVRKETAERVYAAAIKIGYHAASLIERRLHAELPEYRFGFFLHKERHEFFLNFKAAIEQAARKYAQARILLDIQFVSSQTPQDYSQVIQNLGRRYQAVAGIALDHHQITEEVANLKARGIACFSLLSDFAAGVRQSYIGLNNIRVGRGTAWMLARMSPPGKIGLFVGGHRFHGHELRETGFRSYFREYAPQFQLLDTLVNLETRQLTYEATLDLLDRYDDLVGLYCAGGGMEGAIAALRESRPADSVRLIVNEDTTDTRRALRDRYLLMANVTPLQEVCNLTIDMMVQSIEQGLAETPGQLFIPQGFLFPEMIL